MATLKPFFAVHPPPELAEQVCAPPYDVLTREEATALARENPLSALHITRPEVDLGGDVDPSSDEAHNQGRSTFVKALRSGTLVRENAPVYIIHRLAVDDHEQVGLGALASCAEYEKGLIKKHEQTRQDREDDRTRHMDVVQAQSSPVFLTYRSSTDLDLMLAEASILDPDVELTAPDGVRHSLWLLRDAELAKRIESAFAKIPALYIADGHHLAAAAARIARQRSYSTPVGPNVAQEPWGYFLAVAFPSDQARILGYHRAVRTLNGLTKEEFLTRLGGLAEVETGTPDDGHFPTRKGELTAYLGNGQWVTFHWKDDVRARATSLTDRLDVAILQNQVLSQILGITDPRTDQRLHFIGGDRGPADLVRCVDEDGFAVAFALKPVTMDEVMAVVDQGGIMPPKSTWFAPKLADGLMFHLI